MIANDETGSSAAGNTSAEEPTPPPAAPSERPRIEPTDALPSEDQDDTGLLDKAKSLVGNEGPDQEGTDEDSSPSPASTPERAPKPPPVDPADRPRIEPTDALPNDE
jgi:hypothetical protein